MNTKIVNDLRRRLQRTTNNEQLKNGSPRFLLIEYPAHHAERDGYVVVTLRVTSRAGEINTNGGRA